MTDQPITEPQEPVDAEVVNEAYEIVPHTPQAGSTAIVNGANAAERIARATEIATQLDDVIKTQGLRTKIGSRKIVKPDGSDMWVPNYHIDIEAWQTLAAFLELSVVPVWTRRVDDGHGSPEVHDYTIRREIYAKGTKKNDIKNGTATVERVETAQVHGYSWEARVEVYKNGTLISAGDAMVSRNEESWRERDDHALRSMAQTRAGGRAIAGVARWIVTLAGYNGSPDLDAAPASAEASPELRKTTENALAYLLEGELRAIEEVNTALSKHFDGMPAAALQAICIVTKAVKDAREAESQAIKEAREAAAQ